MCTDLEIRTVNEMSKTSQSLHGCWQVPNWHATGLRQVQAAEELTEVSCAAENCWLPLLLRGEVGGDTLASRVSKAPTVLRT